MRILSEILKLSIQHLEKCHVSRARRIAEELLAHTLKLPRIQLYMQFDRPIQENEISVYRELIREASRGKPLEYLLGEIEFFHCTFVVNPNVLIPRQETEILLSRVWEEIKDSNLKGKQAWDICCGCGCLGIALKKALPDLQVTLSDLSEKALETAKKNMKKNQIDVHFLYGDLLTPFGSRRADFILCNPPYVSAKEYEHLDKEVRLFEPRMALLSGETGLEFYERLAKLLPDYLNPGGKVFFEIGSTQGNALKEFFFQRCWKEKKIEKDWSGHDRFFFLEIE